MSGAAIPATDALAAEPDAAPAAVSSRADPAAPSAAPPLAVDLDGTLVMADTLHEGFVAYVRGDPLGWRPLGRALNQGKAAFKREVSGRVGFDPRLLPYNEALLDYLKAEKRAGRTIGLFTAADQSIADAIAAHLGLFDVVRGSDGTTNLGGARKEAAIRDEFGDRFVYAGDSTADMPIFEHSERVILAGPVQRLQARLPAGKAVEAAFPTGKAGPRVWAKALRLPHWAKNTLVFVAPVLAFQFSAPVLLQALLLFLAMGLLASATYLVNDLFDLAADRQHPKKRFRPIASGAIPVRDAVFASAGLVAAAFGIGFFLPAKASLALAAYLAVTLTYSFALKREPLLDVVVLAGLFTLRVLAGNTVTPTPVSPWLLTFSMLFFLGLAAVKRYAELNRVMEEGGSAITARGYTARDLPLLLAAGIASGFAAVVIFTIYLINDQYPRGVYGHPGRLWAMMPVILFWTLRMWHLAVHGRMDEDPVVFALKDRWSLALGAVIVLVLLMAWS
jgi:4-hydroxybenzoate polyprenyltransferase